MNGISENSIIRRSCKDGKTNIIIAVMLFAVCFAGCTRSNLIFDNKVFPKSTKFRPEVRIYEKEGDILRESLVIASEGNYLSHGNAYNTYYLINQEKIGSRNVLLYCVEYRTTIVETKEGTDEYEFWSSGDESIRKSSFLVGTRGAYFLEDIGDLNHFFKSERIGIKSCEDAINWSETFIRVKSKDTVVISDFQDIYRPCKLVGKNEYLTAPEPNEKELELHEKITVHKPTCLNKNVTFKVVLFTYDLSEGELSKLIIIFKNNIAELKKHMFAEHIGYSRSSEGWHWQACK